MYNLLLAEQLKQVVSRLKLKRGSIEVLSWEELLGEIIAVEGVSLEIPVDTQLLGKGIDELPLTAFGNS